MSDLAKSIDEFGASALRVKAQRDALMAALTPFVTAFLAADDPGMSDLDNEQPVSLHVPLGAWRKARSAYREASK